jgi:hypothetical protein
MSSCLQDTRTSIAVFADVFADTTNHEANPAVRAQARKAFSPERESCVPVFLRLGNGGTSE